jgi:predicted glycoside hydrolase/deacetylase ChbG (UPF0249 family)
MKTLASLLLFVCSCGPAAADQPKPKSLAERLGYPADARLLIVHADDLGFSHSVNAATIRALESGAVSSASLMVACPWFPEIADYARSHPDADLGIHLTLTSERTFYRWGPVASKNKVGSLLDANGYFLQDWAAAARIDPAQVEVELRAQIDRAYAMGVRPTHLDSHQNRLFDNGRPLFEALLRVARDYELPVLVPRSWFAEHAYLEAALRPDDIVIDHVLTITPAVTPDKWSAFYEDALTQLAPGVTELVMHPAFDDDEMQAMTRDRATWGAAWRQRDLDFLMSERFRQLLELQNIKRVTWRELQKAAGRKAVTR